MIPGEAEVRLLKVRRAFPEIDHSDELVEVAAWLESAKPTAVSRQLERLTHLQGTLHALGQAMVSLSSVLEAVAAVEAEADPQATALQRLADRAKAWSLDSMAGWVVELAEVRSWLWKIKHMPGRTSQEVGDLFALGELLGRIQQTLLFALAWQRMVSAAPWMRALLCGEGEGRS